MSAEGNPAQFRERAAAANLGTAVAERFLPCLRCPVCRGALAPRADSLVCENGHAVPVSGGFPDFVPFARGALDEKIRQAEFHDDERNNETFDEIVRRPYNGGPVHAESWLYHLRHFRGRLPRALGIDLPGATVLNCGCGGGFEAQFLAEAGASVVGVDISRLRVEAAATRFAMHGLDGFFFRGDAASLPFPDATFDLVVYHDSLHHLPIEEIPSAVGEAARVARVGVALLEAHDSPLRSLLEALGKSSSVERAGNYVFRFRPSLIRFWAARYGLHLADYSVLLTKKQHRPTYYARPILGRAVYGLVRAVGLLLRPLGNEACILLSKRSPKRNRGSPARGA